MQGAALPMLLRQNRLSKDGRLLILVNNNPNLKNMYVYVYIL